MASARIERAELPVHRNNTLRVIVVLFLLKILQFTAKVAQSGTTGKSNATWRALAHGYRSRLCRDILVLKRSHGFGGRNRSRCRSRLLFRCWSFLCVIIHRYTCPGASENPCSLIAAGRSTARWADYVCRPDWLHRPHKRADESSVDLRRNRID